MTARNFEFSVCQPTPSCLGYLQPHRAWPAQPPPEPPARPLVPTGDVRWFLDLLSTTEMTEQYAITLERLLTASKRFPMDRSEDIMLPLLRDLILHSKMSKDPKWPRNAIPQVFRDMFSYYITTAIGVQPLPLKDFEPARIGCGCPLCRVLNAFLGDQNENSCFQRACEREETPRRPTSNDQKMGAHRVYFTLDGVAHYEEDRTPGVQGLVRLSQGESS